MQKQISFFPPDEPELAPSADTRRIWCDPKNEENPFSQFIGNDRAVKRLCRAAFSAFALHNRCCRDQSFAILGPASTGKTTLVKMMAELLDLPFVVIDPRSIATINDILVKIAKTCEDYPITDGDTGEIISLELEEENGHFILPPMVIFIDEVHALRPNIIQGLLKATEKNDCVLNSEAGYTVDTWNVCWCIATTDRGMLFDAFDTRFTKIQLNLYSKEEIAQIVQLKNPDWDMEVCRLVAKFSSVVPREALDFATEMQLEHNMNDGEWEDIARQVAEDNEIDEFGMSHQRVNILRALGNGPIAKNRLAFVAGCKVEELEKFVLPALLANTPDRAPLIAVISKGYSLTEEGRTELDKRGIKHKI